MSMDFSAQGVGGEKEHLQAHAGRGHNQPALTPVLEGILLLFDYLQRFVLSQ